MRAELFCYRCEEVLDFDKEVAEITVWEDWGTGETGPSPHQLNVIVHQGCMLEGEEIA
jgi:hypothetical protein